MEIAASSGTKKIIALLFFLVAAAGALFLALWPSISQKMQEAKITNFQQCAAAGYPVVQSDIRLCSLPNGKFFVQQVVPEK